MFSTKEITPSKLSVAEILSKDKISLEEFSRLINIEDDTELYMLMEKAKRLTLSRFGRAIGLYTPLYVSNKCHNICSYCGFSANNGIPRVVLSPAELQDEVKKIKNKSIENLLLVSGEHRDVGIDYLEQALESVRDKFSYLSIETQPLEDYTRLVKKGLAGVYLYQETYNRDVYDKVHVKGTKKNFDARLEAVERVCSSGVYKMGLGVLLGLGNYKEDAISLAMHLRILQKKYWRTKFSLSFPRLKSASKVDLGDFDYVSEKKLLNLIASFRVLEPCVDLALSTRERQEVRDISMNFGINTMSIASRTSPLDGELEQFSIDDNRTVAEFKSALSSLGYYPLSRDFI